MKCEKRRRVCKGACNGIQPVTKRKEHLSVPEMVVDGESLTATFACHCAFHGK